MEEQNQERLKGVTRRHLFKQSAYGIGSLALGSLLNETLFAAAAGADPSVVRRPSSIKLPQFAPKAKNVIFLFMAGAPSQLDLFDYKPKLIRYNGQTIPEEFVKGERFAFIKGVPKLLGTPHKFARYGNSGQEISSLLPHLQTIADDIAIVRSVRTEQFNHAPAQIYMNCGPPPPGPPAMGSWMTYGLGSENRDLPGFVVLISGVNNPDGGKACWSSGFLPSIYQ